jgi:hypothetical protein
MARKIPGSGGNGMLKVPEKGDPSPNPFGRPKKMTSQLVEFGYTLSEINQTIQNLLTMTHFDLTFVHEDARATALEKIIAKSLLNSINTGSLKDLDKILSRAFGRPSQAIQIIPPPTLNLEIVSDNPINALKEYQDLMKQ